MKYLGSAQTRLSVKPVEWGKITTLPVSRAERTQLKQRLERDLITKFREWLDISRAARNVSQDRLKLLNSGENSETFGMFLIEYAAEKLGPPLLCCDQVIQRIHDWYFLDDFNNSGLAKLTLFNAAIERGARVIRGETYGSIGPAEEAAQPYLKDELLLLRERLLPLHGKNAQFSDAIALIKKFPQMFQYLNTAIASLENFHSCRPEIVSQFLSQRISPAVFRDQWMAYSYNRNPSKLANQISSMRKQ